jgi:hypothetical protein
VYVLAGMASVPREENETAKAGDSDTEFVLARRCFVILCSLLVERCLGEIIKMPGGVRERSEDV